MNTRVTWRILAFGFALVLLGFAIMPAAGSVDIETTAPPVTYPQATCADPVPDEAYVPEETDAYGYKHRVDTAHLDDEVPLKGVWYAYAKDGFRLTGDTEWNYDWTKKLDCDKNPTKPLPATGA